MAKTNWQYNDVVTETAMNQLGQEVNDHTAAIGNMAAVPTTAKNAAGAIVELVNYLNYMPINGGEFDGNDPVGPTVDGGTY